MTNSDIGRTTGYRNACRERKNEDMHKGIMDIIHLHYTAYMCRPIGLFVHICMCRSTFICVRVSERVCVYTKICYILAYPF